MMNKEYELIEKMTDYFSGDPKRIQHFLKVYTFSKIITNSESTDEREKYITNCAAIVHDIGIKLSEEKYGSSSGKYQELEGPAEALSILSDLDFEDDIKERICWLIGHHHTYNNISGLDYQILVESDFLVNMYEDSLDEKAVKTAYEKIFKTETGKRLCRRIYRIII